MPSCESESGRRQPEPVSPEPTKSLPGASLQLTCVNQQRSQTLHGAPSWPISQQLWISHSHRCGCAIKTLTWNLCYWSRLSDTHTCALTTVTKAENGTWQCPQKCKISWWHTPDYMVGELLPSSGTGGCKEEVGCRGMGYSSCAPVFLLCISGVSLKGRNALELLLAQARLLQWSHEPIPPTRAALSASDQQGRRTHRQDPIRAEDAAVPGDGPTWPRSHCPHLTPQGPPGKKGHSHQGQSVPSLSSQKAQERWGRPGGAAPPRINAAVLVGAEPPP